MSLRPDPNIFNIYKNSVQFVRIYQSTNNLHGIVQTAASVFIASIAIRTKIHKNAYLIGNLECVKNKYLL